MSKGETRECKECHQEFVHTNNLNVSRYEYCSRCRRDYRQNKYQNASMLKRKVFVSNLLEKSPN